jgi:hypothetical protein
MDDCSLTDEIVRAKIERALASFFESDRALLESGVREEGIAHKLANYIGEQFEGLDVDAEYDKMHVDGIPHPKKYIGPDAHEHGAIPDIIVHRRKAMDNVIAIEIKKQGKDAGRKKDFEKLRAYKEQLDYRFAVFLEIGLDGDQPLHNIQFF